MLNEIQEYCFWVYRGTTRGISCLASGFSGLSAGPALELDAQEQHPGASSAQDLKDLSPAPGHIFRVQGCHTSRSSPSSHGRRGLVVAMVVTRRPGRYVFEDDGSEDVAYMTADDPTGAPGLSTQRSDFSR